MKSREVVSRTRNYATIVYPESAPANWQEILADMHIPALISPVHDKDVTADGEIKKPHYHVIIMFGGVKTKKQAKEIIDKIDGVGVEVVNNLGTYARYLIHQDNLDKAQYSASDVVAVSGADYSAITYIPADDLNLIGEMLKYINDNQITSFAVFTNACANEHLDWLRVLALKKTSYFFMQYMKSMNWSEPQIFDKLEEDN